MGWREDKTNKWKRVIEENAGKETCNEIFKDMAESTSIDPIEAAICSTQVMECLIKHVPVEETQKKIMLERSCVFVEEFGEEILLNLRRLFLKTDSIDEVIEEMCKDNYKYAKPYREGNIVYETKNPSNPEAYRDAHNLYERQSAYCHCPLARVAIKPLPSVYCYCGGGWYKGIWEFITQRPVSIILLKSIMKGDDCCTFAVHLSEEVVKNQE